MPSICSPPCLSSLVIQTNGYRHPSIYRGCGLGQATVGVSPGSWLIPDQPSSVAPGSLIHGSPPPTPLAVPAMATKEGEIEVELAKSTNPIQVAAATDDVKVLSFASNDAQFCMQHTVTSCASLAVIDNITCSSFGGSFSTQRWKRRSPYETQDRSVVLVAIIIVKIIIIIIVKCCCVVVVCQGGGDSGGGEEGGEGEDPSCHGPRAVQLCRWLG
jgi:hypothetical protein